MREFVINDNDALQRVDKFLTKAVPKLPKTLLYKYLRTKRIKLNGKKCEISTRLNKGDILSLYVNDEFFETSAEKEFLLAPAKIQVVYEDENILLVDKKNGLVVHEDNENSVDTLINRIKHYLYEKGEFIPENELSFAPSLCNRLDRNTGGIVICAKNAESLRILNQKIKDRELQKLYLCVAVGKLPKKSDTITAFHHKDEKNNLVTISSKKSSYNKTMVTKYEVLSEKNGLSLVEVDLITGRTHQIRAHLAYIGNYLLGDGKYGNNKINKEHNVKTQCLYSYKLTFDFKTESGILSYLNGKSFSVNEVWFKETFFGR